MARGGVKTFEGLVQAVGDNSSVDGTSHGSVVVPRAGLSRTVPLKDLVGNPFNPRDSLGDLDDLASIVEFQLQPVVAVTRSAFQALHPDVRIAGRWVVVLGNRRLAAAHKFGRTDLDIVVKDELAKDRATLLTAIIAENVDRAGFDVIEEAKAVENLVAEYGSADAAADHLRKSKTWISHRRALLKLAPELQEATRRGELAIREARSLARVPLEQQVTRWTAAARKNDGPAADPAQDAGEGSGASPAEREHSAATLRAVTRAIRKFDTEPYALAIALRDQLGDTGAKMLASHLRKLVK
ncbi:putative transcriptional regulator (plasmid) [Mycolicibacterium chubuense NBB4]|uniref:Putative transcriptional regulator n=1 Tax=Mycolicibacterium chubuense (strain NBB4) TaxID=710421 RepID=I4BTQ1_MYCCN|nr:ParB/RepB/Spo0J family partition protein [Mycolicibacterium chubuense]AFM20658.1 putative transcriptional regulator [Mycolicibacterium chubuense NBB4]